MPANAYADFLQSKAVTAPMRGLGDVPSLSSHLFQFQQEAVAFGLRAGSWGCFFDTGLGKTLTQGEWCQHAAAASNGRALILTPLAVARQIERELSHFGYQVRVIRSQNDAAEGINVCNYDRLHLIEPDTFGAISLDESSILKNFTGATSRKLIQTLAAHRWRMAATATPAPNDHMELGQHAEYLGVMRSNEMLMRWFIADQTQMGRYRLKHHAVNAFWDWMASWSRMAEHPRDLGDDLPQFNLPPLEIKRHHIEATDVQPPDGELFAGAMISATEMHSVKRQTADKRADAAVSIAQRTPGPVVIWCDTDYEADALLAAFGKHHPDVAEVRGSHPIKKKETALAAFSEGDTRVLITKPSVCGYGLNWQHCHTTIFVGRSFSYESWYQAVRRFWRFGQSRTVDVHLIVAEGEDSIGKVIDRKAGDHARMKAAMVSAMRRATGQSSSVKVAYNPTHVGRMPSWLKGVTQ